MQEIFVNIFHKFDFERQKMAEEKQGGKIITPLGWDIKRNAKGQFVPNNEQLRKLVYDKNVKLSEIDTSEITDMSYLFAFIAEDEEDDELFCKAVGFIAEFYFKREDFSGIGSWDTSRVTTFERMFYMADNFNEDISKWDTSSATNMSGMFRNAFEFNCSLNDWNTSSVTDMSGMFEYADNFNQPLNEWDTSSVTNMRSMFFGAEKFNQPLDKWDTSSVTNMSRMFHSAKSFNQNLSAWGDKLDRVKDMSSMFWGAKSLICDFFSWWETSEVCDLKDRIKDSGVEKLRDAIKKIEKTKDITARQGIGFEVRKLRLKKELAKTLGFDEKESKKIINEPTLSNFDIYKVVINEEDFLKSILPYEGEGEKVVKNWLVKDVAYRVYLLHYNEKNDKFTQDKSGWDFAFCKVFESWFMIKKNQRDIFLRPSNKDDGDNEKLPS